MSYSYSSGYSYSYSSSSTFNNSTSFYHRGRGRQPQSSSSNTASISNGGGASSHDNDNHNGNYRNNYHNSNCHNNKHVHTHNISNNNSSNYNGNDTKKDHDPNSLHQQALLSPSTSQADIKRGSLHSERGREVYELNDVGSNTNFVDANTTTATTATAFRRRRGNVNNISNIHGINRSSGIRRSDESSEHGDRINDSFKNTYSQNSTSTPPLTTPAATTVTTKVTTTKTALTTKTKTSSFKITIVVMFWYLLGVLSITTTKIILRDYGIQAENGKSIQISPLGMTLQQLFIGSIFLKLWTIMETKKSSKTISTATNLNKQQPIKPKLKSLLFLSRSTYYLTLTSIFFTLGFLFTNYSFSNADASFVETIKASEPMTSALLAYLYKIESLSVQEIISLISICFGVLISTLGNTHHDHSNDGGGESGSSSIGSLGTATNTVEGETFMVSCLSSGIVMCSNLCFSFRGLYQKLYRNSVQRGKSAYYDDTDNVNSYDSYETKMYAVPLTDNELQLRVHQIGTIVMLIPFCTLESPLTALSNYMIDSGELHKSDDGELISYVVLALVNAFAFTHYNLASSYVLTRISVVHHAALNCIRRLFAIVMTSFIFGVPINFIAGMGIIVSIGGFIGFTFYKMKRKKQWSMNDGSKLILPR